MRKFLRCLMLGVVVAPAGYVPYRAMADAVDAAGPTTAPTTQGELDVNMIGFLAFALPKLTTLELRSCRLTDASVAALTQLRQLETLDLSFTTVTGASLDVLATLPNLKRLNVTGTSITQQEVLASKLAAKVAVKGAKPPKVEEPGPL